MESWGQEEAFELRFIFSNPLLSMPERAECWVRIPSVLKNNWASFTQPGTASQRGCGGGRLGKADLGCGWRVLTGRVWLIGQAGHRIREGRACTSPAVISALETLTSTLCSPSSKEIDKQKLQLTLVGFKLWVGSVCSPSSLSSWFS